MNYLSSEGISVYDGTKHVVVKLQLIAIQGDNLGLNEVFGFTKSFKTNYYCRICKSTLKEMPEMSTEDKSKIRTEKSYNQDVKKKDSSATGIEEECPFHEILNFHITRNFSLDVLHDYLEGVCSYVVCKVLKSLIFEKKLFKLFTLNNRIQNFDYRFRNTNKPPKMTLERLKNYQTFEMSAAETLCLVRYLQLIIGDLVDDNDEHFQLLKLSRQILDILDCKWVQRSQEKYFEDLIK